MRTAALLVSFNSRKRRLWGCCLVMAALLFVFSCPVPPALCFAGLAEAEEPFRIGGVPVYGPGGAPKVSPAVAFDGTNYMVVWQDYRNGSPDIYGARVSRSGEVLDPEGIAISGGPSLKDMPAIAFDGTGYIVVWADDRNGSWDIYGARVSRSGTLGDPADFAISTVKGTQSYPAIAFNGTRCLVAWHDERADFVDIYGARLSVSGSVIDRNGFLIASGIAPEKPSGPGGLAGPDVPWGPEMATDGDGYFIVWQAWTGESWDIRGARVADSGSVLDPLGLPVSVTEEPEWCPAVAHDGTNYLVAWHAVSGGSFDLFAARVSPSGEVLDPDRIFVSEHRFWQRFPAVGSDGTNFMVFWPNWTSFSQDVYMARVDPAGEVLDPVGASVIKAKHNVQWRPAVAFDGANYLVVCQDERSTSGGNVYGALVNRNGEVVTFQDILISSEGDGPWRPGMAFDGNNYMAVWCDSEEGSGDIHGARVSWEGILLDPDGIPISTVPGGQWEPAISFGGVDYMVVWCDDRNVSRDIYGARVRPSGFVFNPAGIRISSSKGQEQDQAIAFDGTNYLVVWAGQRDGSWDIYGARVSQLGSVLDPSGLEIATADGQQRHPAVAFDGMNYLVVWEDDRGGSWDIYGTRVTPAGLPLDTGGIPISTQEDDEWTPAISYDGSNFMVAWQTWDGGSGDIHGARVSPSGSVLGHGRAVISAAAGRQWRPAITFDGTYHIVTWGDSRNGGNSVDVYAARVSTSGGVIDPAGLPVSTEEDSQLLPALASDNSGHVLTAYSTLIPSSIFGYWRIWATLWDPPMDPPLELTLGVHQNPELTTELDIYVVPSKAVQDTSVWVAVDGAPLEVKATDAKGSIYRARYRILAAGPILISARARDLAGDLAETSREFGAGFVAANVGGTVNGPMGMIKLQCPPGSVDFNSYVLVVPEEVQGQAPLQHAKVGEPFEHDGAAVVFLLSPPSLNLKRAASLSVRMPGETLADAAYAAQDGFELRPLLWREERSGWELVGSSYNEVAGTLRASVSRLGRYKVAWVLQDNPRSHLGLVLTNVPNPFRSVLDIRYHLPQRGRVLVSAYDANGRLVKMLFSGERGPGWYSETWDGTDGSGTSLPSGIYFTDVRLATRRVSKKCVLIR